MTLYQLKVFITVSKLRSFTQASRSLGVRQPSVTLLIQSLQRELGAKLFDRLGNKIKPTRAGEELVGRAEDILAKVTGIRNKVDEIMGLKKGRIVIGGSQLLGTSDLPTIVCQFSKVHEGVDVSLKVDLSTAIEKSLLEGEVDVAVISRAPESSLLVVKPYRDEEAVISCAANHPLTKKRAVSLQALSKEQFVIGKKGESQLRDQVDEIFARKGLPLKVALEVSATSGSRDVIRTAVASGLGLSFSFRSGSKSYIAARQIKVLKVPEIKLKRSTYIVVHKNRANTPLVKAFISFLRRFK